MSTVKTNKVQCVTTSDLTLDTASTSKRVVIPTTTGDDVDLDALSGRLVIGNIAGVHLAIDENELEAKSDTTTAATLYLQRDGGKLDLRAPMIINSNGGDVASGAAIPLTSHASLFETGGSGETSTLAAGTEGQIKYLALKSDGGGDMVVTVTNASWKASGTGTLTFNSIGDCALLQYIASKWFLLGGSGVLFG